MGKPLNTGVPNNHNNRMEKQLNTGVPNNHNNRMGKHLKTGVPNNHNNRMGNIAVYMYRPSVFLSTTERFRYILFTFITTWHFDYRFLQRETYNE
jgi:hypothetical protein